MPKLSDFHVGQRVIVAHGPGKGLCGRVTYVGSGPNLNMVSVALIHPVHASMGPKPFLPKNLLPVASDANQARFGDIDQRRVRPEDLGPPIRDLGAMLRRTEQQKFKPGDVVAIFGKSQGIVVGEGVIKNGREKVYIIHLQEPFVDRHGVTHSTTTSGPAFLIYQGRWDPRTQSVVPEDRPLPP